MVQWSALPLDSKKARGLNMWADDEALLESVVNKRTTWFDLIEFVKRSNY